MPTHGEKRLGLLTSSCAHIIMSGSGRAWESYSRKLWAEGAEAFDAGLSRSVRSLRYGHEHEAEGAAKFWEKYPDVSGMLENQFFTASVNGVPLGSSPDRVLEFQGPVRAGLEVKSPVTADAMAAHTPRQHYDQCQHGMLVSGLPLWFLITHFGEDSTIWKIEPDAAWAERYQRRASAFWNFHNTGEKTW